MNNNLLILGAGGHGITVKETAAALGIYDKIDFLDDNSSAAIGKLNDHARFLKDYKFAFVAIGHNELRMNWARKLVEAGFSFPVLIHPNAVVSKTATVKEGTFIGSNAVVNTKAVIEKGCILSIGALVDHDAKVGEFAHIDTGAVVKSCAVIAKYKKINAGTVAGPDDSVEDYSFETGV